MTKQEIIRRMEQANRLVKLGLTYDEAEQIRRISMALHRWAEHECNGNIQRDEVTNRPLWFSNYQVEQAKTPKGYPIPDRETGAINRLDRIMAKYPELDRYIQGDPRGAQVYIHRLADLQGRNIDSVYSSIGVAVY